MAEKLEDFLRNLGQHLDGKLKTRTEAVAREEEARQEFLQEFRNVVAGVILPVFERAARVTTEALSSEIDRGLPSKEHVAFKVAAKLSPTMTQQCQLRYRADFMSKKVFLGESIGDHPIKDEQPINLAQLTSEEVEQRLTRLLSHIH